VSVEVVYDNESVPRNFDVTIFPQPLTADQLARLHRVAEPRQAAPSR
jgi:hypothetical protein